MKRMTSQYPEGATWRAVSSKGVRGSVWLERRAENSFETWRWSVCRADGSCSPFDNDWSRTRRACVEECAARMRFKGNTWEEKIRFKRIEKYEPL